MKNAMQKRILMLLEYLYTKTDEQHPATIIDLLNHLAAAGIKSERRSVYSDIAILDELGVDVICLKSRQNQYYIGARHFQLPELKLLVDAIQSSRFVTPKKSAELIDKLRLFAGEHQAQQLDRQIYMDGMAKPENERIYYTVDIIHNAIAADRKITFQYGDYTPDKKKVYRHDGMRYTLSPYGLLWNRDYYYVVGFYERRGEVSSFRVDRMENAAISNEARIMQDGFDIRDYGKEIFGMYPDKVERVELLCRNDMMRSIVDRFGEDVETAIYDSEHFKATVEVAPSPPFFAWVFTFGGGIQIISPEDVITEMREMASWLVK